MFPVTSSVELSAGEGFGSEEEEEISSEMRKQGSMKESLV